MSSKSTIFLTDCNTHWYEEGQAKYYCDIVTPDDRALVLEFGPECLIEDYQGDGFGVVIPSNSRLARIIMKAAGALSQAERSERVTLQDDQAPQGK